MVKNYGTDVGKPLVWEAHMPLRVESRCIIITTKRLAIGQWWCLSPVGGQCLCGGGNAGRRVWGNRCDNGRRGFLFGPGHSGPLGG